ncbi:2,3-bisphosphoglycerate-dependent phosphoglycerate mutase [Burkholderia cepacia]|nr:2,3-bisphosphoglycerate-dependent phosphoglycerate mutase [Burkholderia cepacia]
MKFDFAFTSILRRSVDTLMHIQDVMRLKQVPVVHSWRLNERHYGALSGHDKAEMARLYGAERLARWRRGYDVRPPPAPDELQHRLLSDPRYAVEAHETVPETESLKDTLERAVPFWAGHIRPLILRGETVLLSGHGNWIRMLIKHLDDVGEDRLEGIEVGNAEPIVYDFDMRVDALGDWRL